jgi:hypothetical protein
MQSAEFIKSSGQPAPGRGESDGRQVNDGGWSLLLDYLRLLHVKDGPDDEARPRLLRLLIFSFVLSISFFDGPGRTPHRHPDHQTVLAFLDAPALRQPLAESADEGNARILSDQKAGVVNGQRSPVNGEHGADALRQAGPSLAAPKEPGQIQRNDPAKDRAIKTWEH